jgi:diadenosine tetraphosphate (Ap4A) HIT family hydrolase
MIPSPAHNPCTLWDMTDSDCILCAGSSMDHALMVEEVWGDEIWRLTTVRVGELAGYSYLSPRRHIPHITDLEGAEAATFGSVVAMASNAIKDETGAELVYLYVFGGGLDHFHVHLAPHREPGSPLVDDPIKGAKHMTHLPSGEEVWSSDRYPLQSAEIMRAAIAGIRTRLSGPESDDLEAEGGEDLP